MVRARLPIASELPATRAECVDGPRPCPLVSCRLHLATERVAEMSDDEALELLMTMPETCAQDVASRGETTLQGIADAMGLPLMTVADAESRAKRKAARLELEVLYPEHPDDPYLKYSLMGADELAEVAAILRAREKGSKR